MSQDADELFEEVTANLVLHVLEGKAPELAVLSTVRGWFDHKWLRFSGIGRVPFDSGGMSGVADVSLDAMSMDQLTFPAFHPNRILTERHLRREGAGRYQRVPRGRESVRPRFLDHSSANLHRRVADHGPNAVFFWFSEPKSGRASTLVYHSLDGNATGWFAGFRFDGVAWRVDRTKEIDRGDVLRMMTVPLHPTVHVGRAGTTGDGVAHCVEESKTVADRFLQYCEHGRLEDLEQLLRTQSIDVDVRDEDGCTGLHLAIGDRHRRVVELLVEYDPDFSITDDAGYSAFHWAILAGEAYYLDLVSRHGSGIGVPDVEGNLPIHLCIMHRERRSLQWLLARGADVDARDGDGYTALHHCALRDLSELADSLLAAGASTRIENNAGETALGVAIRRGSSVLAETLRGGTADDVSPIPD